MPAFLAFRSISQHLKQTIHIKQHLGSYIYILYKKVAKKGALATPSPKRLKTTKRTLKKHLENPPEIHASQGRHTLNNGGLYSRAPTKTTPSNGPPQQERANTTPQNGKTSIKKASNKIQSLLNASSICSYGGATVSHNELI